MLRILALLTSILCSSGSAFAQNKADRKDEHRENRRVNDAKQEVQRAQRELSASVKEYRNQYSQVQQAERKLLAAQATYHNARETAEEQLEDSSGLPELIRKMRGLRDEIALLSKPILAQLYTTDEWKAADKKRHEAQQTRERLLADNSRTDDELTDQLAELDKQIVGPDYLANAAVDADSKVKQLKIAYHQSLSEIGELRRKVDAAKVDADPQVSTAKSAVADGQRDTANKRKQLASLNAKVAKHQAALVGANRNLQQAQAADQKDRNQPKPNKKS